MAIYNEILVGRYARFLQKLFGIKGGVPAKQLAGEIMPVFPVFFGIENRYLESWQRFGFTTFLGGVSGNVGGFRIRNPGGSNVVAVIEKFLVANESAANNVYSATGGAFVTDLSTIFGLTGARLDPRGNPQPTCIVSGQNTTSSIAGGTNGLGRVALVSSTTDDLIWQENQELPLLPGDGYQLVSVGLNQAITIGWIWRERFLEDSERA